MTNLSALKTTTLAGVAALVAGLATVAAPPLSGTAEAAPRQPDYAKYCRQVHPGSSVQRLNTTGAYVCTLRSRLQMRHYRISLARACMLTTGNPSFRNHGRGYVLCNDRVASPRPGPRPGPRPTNVSGRQPNYKLYCSRVLRGSFVSRLNTTGEYVCTLRSRLQQRYYKVNYAQACQMTTGSPRFRNHGRGYVLCTGRGVVRNPRTFPKPRPTVRPNPRPTRTQLRAPNLRAYCARNHRGSILNRLRTTGQYICTIRTRLQMRHYRINIVRACYTQFRTTRVRYLGRNNPRCVVRV